MNSPNVTLEECQSIQNIDFDQIFSNFNNNDIKVIDNLILEHNIKNSKYDYLFGLDYFETIEQKKMIVQFHMQNKYNLTLFNKCPLLMNIDIRIDDLDKLIIGRIKMYEWCSTLNYDHRIDIIYNPNNSEFKYKLKENMLNNFVFDNYTHLLCCLIFSVNKELQKWYIHQECNLWRIKFCMSTYKIQMQFLKDISIQNNDFNYIKYEQLNFKMMKSLHLLNKYPIPNLSESSATIKWIPYHKVPFNDCLYLVQQRRIYLENGHGFVPNYLFYIVVEQKYRKFLQNKLNKYKQMNLLSDFFLNKNPELKYEFQKIIHILNGYVLKNISQNKHSYKNKITNSFYNIKISHDNIITNYLKYFPLCMRYIFHKLIMKRHVKNGGRLQLLLFLKNIGLPMKEAFKFWNKYEQKINYKYYVNYYYKQKNYSSTSCQKLINMYTNIDDCNGCPFKVFDKDFDKLLKLLKLFYSDYDIKNVINIKIQHNDNKHETNYNNKHILQCKKLFHILYLKNQSIIDIEDVNLKMIFPKQYFSMAHSFDNKIIENMNKSFSKKKKLLIKY